MERHTTGALASDVDTTQNRRLQARRTGRILRELIHTCLFVQNIFTVILPGILQRKTIK